MNPNTLINAHTGQSIPMAMQKLEITGKIYPLGSLVRVVHFFRCSGPGPMEAIYVSALPTGGALRRFRVQGEGFDVCSKLEPRQEALATYEAGVDVGHLSALAEVNPDGLVQISVGQVQPGEMIRLVLDMVVGVTAKDQSYSFRVPLTLAPCYQSSAKVSLGVMADLGDSIFDEDVFLPEWVDGVEGLHEVGFHMQVFGGDQMTVASPSHRISVAPSDDSIMVGLAGMDGTPNRDLIIDVSFKEAQPVM